MNFHRRVQSLRRASLLTLLFGLLVTAVGTFLFVLLVPAGEQSRWANAPLAGLAQHLAGPWWARDLVALGLIAAALLLLRPAAHVALEDAEQLLRRLSGQGAVSERLASLHSRFGTPSRALDVAAAATILVILASGGRVTWLARAYAMGIAATVALKIATLVRLRRVRPGGRPFRTPLNLHVGTREVPLGLLGPGLLIAASAGPRWSLAMCRPSRRVTSRGACSLFTGVSRGAGPPAVAEEPDALDLLPAADLSLDQVNVRPGNLLIPVRNPHSLLHVAAALQNRAIATSSS